MTRYLLFCSKLYSLDILRPLAHAARAKGFEVAWFLRVGREFLGPEEQVLSSAQDVINWSPDAVLVPGNWVPHFFPGLKVEVFHGFPIQKPPADRHFRIRGLFDLYCTQGPSSTGPFEELAAKHKHFRVRETGWSKVDALFREEPRALPADSERKTVLLGSTFSKRASCAPHLVEEIKRLAAKGSWRWFVTLHPKIETELVNRYRALEGPNLTFIETPNLLPAMKAADVMLCDTSSIATEFLLQLRPVVTFRTVTPSPHLLDVTEVNEVEPAIAAALEPSSELRQSIEEFARQTHPYRDGRSAERVIEAVEEVRSMDSDSLRSKPIGVIRRLKARKKLRYWKP